MDSNNTWKDEQGGPGVIFGPVPSRRLGISLGVDVVPRKVCSYDCVYCELGATSYKTLERREYVPADEAVLEMERALQEQMPGLDFVTFSGSGEPTLNSALGRLIEKARSLTETPVAVLTNGSLLTDPGVRRELAISDVVLPSLDAARERSFQLVNRPVKGIALEDVIQGIRDFSVDFEGECWLEVLIVREINDSPADIEALVEAVSWIEPSRVQLTTIIRPPGMGKARPVVRQALERIERRLKEVANVEIVAAFDPGRGAEYMEEKADRIASMLRIRPVTLEDLAASTGLHASEVIKHLNALGERYRISEVEFMGKRYFNIPH